MLQILIWSACVLIFGVGYCGWRLEEMLAVQKGAKESTGIGFFILMTLLAGVILAMSLLQGTVFKNILK